MTGLLCVVGAMEVSKETFSTVLGVDEVFDAAAFFAWAAFFAGAFFAGAFFAAAFLGAAVFFA